MPTDGHTLTTTTPSPDGGRPPSLGGREEGLRGTGTQTAGLVISFRTSTRKSPEDYILIGSLTYLKTFLLMFFSPKFRNNEREKNQQILKCFNT